MKFYRLAIMIAFVLGVVAFGCKPDNVTPSDNDEIGAYAQNDTDHSDILPLCSSSLQSWPLVSWNYLNTGSNVTLGYLRAGNDLERVGFLFETSSFVFGEVALWYDQGVCGSAAGNKVCNVPKDANGNWIPSAYSRYVTLNPVTPDYSIFISMTEVQGVFTASGWAKAYFMVINPTTGQLEPQITTPLWAVSKSTGGPGSLFDVALTMGGCPGACEPWIGATTNPCASAVTTGTTTEGDCSATKGKNKCLSETTVDWDCNDASCVSVSSCKDLSNVVLVTADGTHQKYDGLSAKTGTFCASNGGDIVTVYVKSGCYKSGEGPGYGWRHDNPLNCNGGGTTGGSTGGGTTIDI